MLILEDWRDQAKWPRSKKKAYPNLMKLRSWLAGNRKLCSNSKASSHRRLRLHAFMPQLLALSLRTPDPTTEQKTPMNSHKKGPKYQADIRIPPTPRDRKKIRIIIKCQKNTETIRFSYFGGVRGGSEGVFRGYSRFVCWGVLLHFVGFPIL